MDYGTLDEDIIENNLEFIPTKKVEDFHCQYFQIILSKYCNVHLQDDGQALSCVHTKDDKEYESDPITVDTFILVVDPIQPIIIMEGDHATITVTAQIYPPPANEDITWEILDQTIVGDDFVVLKPGDSIKGYSALNVKVSNIHSISLLLI